MGFADARFDVNLSILFTELPLLERPAAAAAAGFDAVELWWPWPDDPTPDQVELDDLRSALEAAGTRLVGLNFYAGQLPGPDRGALSLPGAESDRFRANIEVAAEFAASVGCTALNALYGNRVDGRGPGRPGRTGPGEPGPRRPGRRPDRRDPAGRGAQRARVAALPAGRRAPAAVDVVDKVNAATGLDNARFLLDLYHLAMNGEDLPAVIARHAGIGPAMCRSPTTPAAAPPAPARCRWRRCSTRLRKAGYTGWTGLEYKPSAAGSRDSFGWLPR